MKEGLTCRSNVRPSSAARSSIWSLPGGRCPSVAEDLGVSAQTIYSWRRQDAIDRGDASGLTSSEQAELKAARRRIRELESELAVTRRANELLKARVVSPKDDSRRSR